MINKIVKTVMLVLIPAITMAQTTEVVSDARNEVNNLLVFLALLLVAVVLMSIIIGMNALIKGIAGSEELWSKKWKTAKENSAWLLLPVFFVSPSDFKITEDILWIMTILDVLLLITVIILFGIMKKLMSYLEIEVKVQTEEKKELANMTLWQKFDRKFLTKGVAIEKESAVMTDHEYDGIKELDNVLPPWWVYMFYATIIFSVVYLGHYHVFATGKSQLQEYEAEMEKGRLQKEAFLAKMENLIDENNVTFLDNASDLSAGKAIFELNCTTCHGDKGQGGAGPNLTDPYWIHGGSISDIFKVVKYGVTERGMIAWKDQMTPKQMQQVVSYILSLQGSNPEGALGPQGSYYAPEAENSTKENSAKEDLGTDTIEI